MTCHTFPHRDPSLKRAWTLREEALLVMRRRERKRAKVIARELGRTPESVAGHVQTMRERLNKHLRQYRNEELALLERLLAEMNVPEMLGDERT